MPGRHIVGLRGGGFSMESNPVLDDYILGLARSERPRICFVLTASGDNENYVVRFYRRFTNGPCQPTHLELFRRSVRDLAEFARSQDVIYRSADGDCFLHSMVVAPEWQSRGIGSAVIAQLKAQWERMSLTVLKTNPRARHFYERAGFREVGQTQYHYQMAWASNPTWRGNVSCQRGVQP